MTKKHIPSLSRQTGMTLIELMIAMILGLILIAGVLYVFLGSSKTFRTSDALARVQENGRFGLEAISGDLRMISYTGCVSMQVLNPESVVSGLSSDDLFSAGNVVRGYPYSSGDPIVGPIVGPLGVPGSDVIIVRHLSESVVELNGDMLSSSDPIVLKKTAYTPKFEEKQIVAIADCDKMHIFRITNVAETTTTVSLSHAVGTAPNGNTMATLGNDKLVYGALLGAKTVRLVEQAYYVKNTGRLNTAGQPVFGLFRRATVAGIATGAAEEELAEGVEDMRISYGLDTDGTDGYVNNYVGASTITAQQWESVVSIRIELLVSSVQNASLDSPQAYTFNGTTTTPADRKLRTSIGSTVSLRNRDHIRASN